jgi:hypothetical protein
MDTSIARSPRWPMSNILGPEARPTREGWPAWQARHGARARQRPEDVLWTEREHARLRFHRWLYETGRLDPYCLRTPPLLARAGAGPERTPGR